MRKLLSYAAIGLACIYCTDVAGRQLLDGSTSFSRVESTTSDSRVLFVHLPGILTSRTPAETVSFWSEYGDVLLVGYTGSRFDGSATSEEVAHEITARLSRDDYDTIVFIGSSMGGLVAYDTYARLDPSSADYRFILIDAPTRRADLQSPLDTISLGSYLWWAGPISNPFSSLYFDATFVEPKEENIEPGVNRDQLADYVAHAKSHPLSWAMDQNRYIIGHKPIEPGSLSGVRVLYMRSIRDTDTVRQQAFDVWDAATGGTAEYLEVDSTHVGYVERPETWREAFENAVWMVLTG